MDLKPVKLGLMPPLSGIVGIYGPEIVHAAQIACQEINQNGGVLGRPLELIIEDDGSLPESSVAAAKKLVEEHHCSAIIGNLLSNSRIAVAYSVAEPRKIPYLNFSFYEGSIVSRYFFHFAALPNQQINKMIPYMRDKFGPRMFFAGNNYEWPRGSIHAAKAVLENIGGEAIGEEYTPIGVSSEDIEKLLDRVEATAPDVFVPYFAGQDQVDLLTRFTERGLKKKMAVVMGHYDELMASKLSSEVREGFYSSNTYFMTVNTKENKDYLERLAKLPDVNGIWPEGDGILTNFGEGTYACVKAFANAANEAGSLDPEVLVDTLKDITVTSPQGSITMNPDHHHAAINTYLSRCNADGVFEIVENFGMIEAVLPSRYSHQRISHQATIEDEIRLQSRILEQMSEAILLISTQDGSILYSNTGAAKTFGYELGELNGQHISQIDDPQAEDVNNTSVGVSHILMKMDFWQGESQAVKKDGTPIWCSSSISTFTHPVFGEVWLLVSNDITQTKHSEQELQKERDFSSNLIDAAPVIILLLGNHREIQHVNAHFEKLSGYSLDEVKGKDWVTTFLPERDRDRITGLIDNTLLKGTVSDNINPILIRSGEEREIEWQAQHMRDANGEVTGILSIGLDVTERLQHEKALQLSEKRFTKLAHATPVGIYQTDINRNLIFVNKSYQNIFGVTEKDVLGSGWRKYIHPDDLKKVLSERDLASAEKRILEMEYRILKPDGKVIWLYTQSIPERDEKGDIISHVGSVTDITKIKKVEAELQEHREHLESLVEERTASMKAARDEAERANKAKSEFLSHMSHELRTPLNAILGFGQMLEMDFDDFNQTQQDNVGEILDAGHHLLDLINYVLDLAKIESGKLQLSMEEVHINDVVQQCLTLINGPANDRHIKVTNTISSNRQIIMADYTRIKQVLLNLLSNAVKYNRDHGEISMDCETVGKNRLRIYVRDTGEGLSEKEIEKLFTPFERLKKTQNVEGTGIGLVITKHLVDLMGGTMGVKSVPEEGSSFWIEFSLILAA